MTDKRRRRKRKVYRADYRDATAEQVAAAVLKYRRPTSVPVKRPARGS